MPQPYSTLHVTVADGIAGIVLDNPPVNVISATMMAELRSVLGEFRDDRSVRVIVFSSANPEFFLAHVDMHILDEEDLLHELTAATPHGVNVFQAVGELLRSQPQPIIVKLAGKARGGGAEFVAAADMVFAATETAGIGQIESLMGIVPAGGGTQYLLERVGRNRALEIVLTGDLYDATTAAAYGWINRAVPAAELDTFVDRVARDIAGLADGVALRVKEIFSPGVPVEGYEREEKAWSALIAGPAALPLMSRALEHGAQTPEGEADLEHLMRSVRAGQREIVAERPSSMV
ncbi:enoyl-CoA hydratase/isomerase family protein [Actinoplanes couchii]|uniref:Enoyl-CoA hydratase n=1 Tax=Actinoplanes couchii TaxID=403638 RepID=A0ABQ3XNX8_9ACTN|nr:enoyl-CoA hydratase/isomerase family protein [Actinoplanes couchii]MDR6319653.1 enoyl-CoA hydratase/carnithine racemase [Actinoplanes couchii]GID60127.1 enoyl-CoA hydratase [Actinoplanes couchii]